MVNSRMSERQSRRQLGRRGPAVCRRSKIHQVAPTESCQGKLAKRPLLKPSLTPGVGTCRLVRMAMESTESLRFTMEPKEGEEAFQQWHEAVRRMARLGDGLPSFVRRRVWSILADHHFKTQYVDWSHTLQTAFTNELDTEDDTLGLQITKDLHRTGCEQFGSEEDRAALQRVLFAYARWNKRVGYCQGFNVIAATILEVTERDEKEAFKIMVYLIDFVLPEFYFVHNLQALSVDIAVFRHLLQARLPKLAAHLDRLQEKAAQEAHEKLGFIQSYSIDGSTGRHHGAYEPPLINVYAIQWFLTLFNSCMGSDAVLRIWDSLFLEGSEIILRTALVIMDFLASRLLKLKSADQFYCTMSGLLNDLATGQIVSTRELMLEIYELAPFPMPMLKELREKFMYNITPLVSTSVESVKLELKRNPKDRRRSFRLFGLWRSKNVKSLEERSDTRTSKVKNNDYNGNGRTQTSPVKEVSTTTSKDDFQEIALQIMPPSGIEESHTDKPPDSPVSLFNGNSPKKNSNFFSNFWKKRSKSISTPEYDLSSEGNRLNSDIDANRQVNGSPWYKNSMKEQRRRSEASGVANPKDISKIGPGAVPPSPTGVRPDDRIPSAHEARMSADWKQLRTQYKKQLAGQSKATLQLRGLWNTPARDTGASVLHHSPIMAVLPQTKESKEMGFFDSVDPSVPEFIMQDDWSSHRHNSVTSQDDTVFLESVSEVQLPDESTHADRLDVIGAVQSWRAKAVWSTAPVVEENEAVNSKQTELETTCNALSIIGAESREIPFDTVSEISCTYQSVYSGSCPQSPLRRCSSQTTFGSFCSERTAAVNSFSFHNGLPPKRVGTDDDDEDAASFYTSISSKKPNCDPVAPNPKITHYLPLSSTRRQFGARFGLYRVQQTNDMKQTSSNFCDRIQFIARTRTAMAKQISNQA